jgi:light-regulated signal transduction histidine kinase (bacteriophytochrome)
MQEPLRKIHTFSSFLQQNQKAELDEKSKIYLSKIGASAERMQTIIDDLLNYSHYTRDDEVFTPTDLNTVIENIESDLELVIKEKSAIILKRPLPTIEAVPSQMHQLFYNLITNALKFSRPGVAPQVTISCSDLDAGRLENIPKLDKSKRYLEICVTDNGIGFDQSHADKIFNLFNRLHGKAEYSGTGIGLALCKKVAENHKGTIRATSEPGKGATFSVVLPAD